MLMFMYRIARCKTAREERGKEKAAKEGSLLTFADVLLVSQVLMFRPELGHVSIPVAIARQQIAITRHTYRRSVERRAAPFARGRASSGRPRASISRRSPYSVRRRVRDRLFRERIQEACNVENVVHVVLPGQLLHDDEPDRGPQEVREVDEGEAVEGGNYGGAA